MLRSHKPASSFSWTIWIPITLCAIGLFLLGAGMDEHQYLKDLLIKFAFCVPAILYFTRLWLSSRHSRS